MQLTETDGKFIFDDLILGDQLLFHSQGYKDALFPVTIRRSTARFRHDNAGEDEISDQQKELIRLFEK
jgi:hypothetical protein